MKIARITGTDLIEKRLGINIIIDISCCSGDGIFLS